MISFPNIPGCKITSVLGVGGVSTVYLGIQENLDRRVAIKVLNPVLLKNKVTAARFEREAKTIASLSHSNIVQIFDTGKAGDYHYTFMEYLEESLKDRMKRNVDKKMDIVEVLDIIEAVFKALDYAHLKGIFHRDIKPDNIMFRQDSTPVLVDFGIAHLLNRSGMLTQRGTIIGSTDYMSPEQCKGETIDGRSDIYSLGVIFFELLSGEKPYKGKTDISVVLQHIEKPIPQLPHELSRYQPLIDSMMAKNKEHRLSTVALFMRMLERIITSPVNSSGLEELSTEIPKNQLDSVLESSGLESTHKKSRLDFIKKGFGSFKKSALRTKLFVGIPLIFMMVIWMVLNFSQEASNSDPQKQGILAKLMTEKKTGKSNV